MFVPDPPHAHMSLDGVEIITNSSGSHFSLQKLDVRLKLISEATRKCGGIYLYANQQGCDGERLYFDGCALILVNGQIVAQGSQFSLNDVEVITATIDLEDVRAYRSSMSRGLQAASTTRKYNRIQTSFELGPEDEELDLHRRPTPPREPKYHTVEEEIALVSLMMELPWVNWLHQVDVIVLIHIANGSNSVLDAISGIIWLGAVLLDSTYIPLNLPPGLPSSTRVFKAHDLLVQPSTIIRWNRLMCYW
jgi:hypothetical protein